MMKTIRAAAFVLAATLSTGALALDPGTYKVGFVTDNTGPLAFAGVSFSRGAELAAQQISDGGYMAQGAKLELVTREGAGDAARSIQGYNQLVADRSIIATACCILSPIAGSIKPIALNNKMPLVIYGATAPGLPSLPYVYSVTGLPGPAEVAMSRHIAGQIKPKTVAYFVLSDNEAFQGRFKASQAAMEATGAKTVGVVSVLSADTDFTASATQAIALKPDLMMVFTTQTPAAGIVQAVRARGWAGAMAANDAISPAAVFKKIGPALAGVPFPVNFSADASETPKARGFVEAYRAKHGADPDLYAAQGYTSIWLIAQGLRSLPGKPTREALGAAMAKIETMEHDVYGGLPIVAGQAATKYTLFLAWNTAGQIVPWKP